MEDEYEKKSELIDDKAVARYKQDVSRIRTSELSPPFKDSN